MQGRALIPLHYKSLILFFTHVWSHLLILVQLEDTSENKKPRI